MEGEPESGIRLQEGFGGAGADCYNSPRDCLWRLQVETTLRYLDL